MTKLHDKFFNRIIEGDLELDGQVKGNLELESGGKAKIFENIVDKDGHKRFIEGEGTPSSIEGVTSVYCRWSLSGSHLMLVYAGNIANETEIGNGNPFAKFYLPEWIASKIYPVWSTNRLQILDGKCYADDWTEQPLKIVVDKLTDSTGVGIQFTKVNALTLTAERAFRLAFDLLIDNE